MKTMDKEYLKELRPFFYPKVLPSDTKGFEENYSSYLEVFVKRIAKDIEKAYNTRRITHEIYDASVSYTHLTLPTTPYV